jgi:lambda family phage portal protein
MNTLDKVIAYVSPLAGMRRIRARAVTEVMEKQLQRLGYDGAKTGRRTEGWVAAGTSANQEIGSAIVNLRNRSRDLARNNPYASRALDILVANAVGTGIVPKPKTKNKKVNAQILDLFDEWETQCDAEGQSDFYALQAMATRAVIESGSVFHRLIVNQDKTMDVPLTIKTLESDFLDRSRNYYKDDADTVSGIELDKYGRRLAYWMFPRHPGDTGWAYTKSGAASQRVEAYWILHTYKKDRPGQIDGVPFYSSVIMKLQDLGDYDEAELVRKKIEACFAAFVTRPEGPDGPGIAPDSANSPDSNGNRLEALEPGIIEYLKEGETVSFGTPSAMGGYAEYLKCQLHAVAAGIGVTYEQLTSDLSNVNYSSYRAGLIEFRRMIEFLRWNVIIPMFCIPVWRRFIDTAALKGKLPPTQYDVDWTAPKFGTVDPMKDTLADIKAVRSGLKTLPEAIIENGYDPDRQLDEIAESNKRLDELEIILDCDPRNVNESGQRQTPDEPIEPIPSGAGPPGKAKPKTK